MSDLLATVATQSERMNIILLIGVAVFGGTIGAKVFQRLRIPQIVGYIIIGVVLGPMLSGFISEQTIETLEPFNAFALGIIGFLIGCELKRDIFAKFGRQVFAILLFEGMTAFLLVGVLSFILMWLFFGWQIGIATGAVFGAICAATDPASTTSVLWEYKTRGPITTLLTAIVALDDALALILYIISIGIAGVVTGHQEGGLLNVTLSAVYEIAGSLGLGVILGFTLNWIMKYVDDVETTLVFALGLIILNIGLARSWKLDAILSSMALGVTLINLSPRRSLKSFELIRKFSPPVYVLFFVLIGARLNISNIDTQILLLAGVYLFGSIVGKTAGTYWGACYSKAAPTVRKYLGFCLYQQGTIAIALLIMASSRFEGHIRDVMLSVVIIGVLVFQLIGPLFVKMGTKKAGEIGMNITEEDLIESYKVEDVMDKKVPYISAGLLLKEVIKIVSDTDNFYYPVIDNEKKLIGVVSLDGIRNTFNTQELNDWLVALDIMEPVVAKIAPDIALADALAKSERLYMQYLPIVASDEDNTILGILDSQAVHRSLSAEVLSRQQKADSMHGV